MNMSPRTPMPLQPAETRRCNFDEAALGYTREMAVLEAARCLHCKNAPCMSACPVNVRIPDFIEKLAAGNAAEALRIISVTSSLPAVCGRVCPQERQCESKCVRGVKGEPVAIGRLERYAADHGETGEAPSKPAPNGHRVAVVGSGPSGLACAGDLLKLGYEVTVFEALHAAGGVLRYGIPEFRLPKSIVDREIEKLRRMGAVFEPDTVIGRTLTADELFEMGYEALFLGTGAGLPRFMGIPGEGLNGVYSANEYLTRINLMEAHKSGSATPILRGKHAAVVGGGNVAMDAARCALRMGAETVTVIYRRSREELPARAEEVEHAKEEGVLFRFLCTPTRLLPDENGFVRGMECAEMELGDPGPDGRRRPVLKPDSTFELDSDLVIMAIGTSPNPLICQTTPGLETDRHGCLVLRNENGLTSRENIYAGGDAVTGAATVILAMGAGKQAAAAIDRQLNRR